MACRFTTLLLGLLITGAALGHVRSESFSRWQYADGMLSMRFTLNAREATRIPHPYDSVPLQRVLAGYLEQKVTVPSADGNCLLSQGFYPLNARPGFLQVEAVWQCAAHPAVLEIHAFFELAAEHTHFASFESDGQMRQRFLSGQDQVWLLGSGLLGAKLKETGGNTFRAYLGQGFRHILSGLDHIVFLLALLLICRRAIDIVWAVSGFTLGHSISLSLAALGMAHPNVPAVEATIGLTIALVAVERSAGALENAVPLAAICAALLLLMVPLTSMFDAPLGAGSLTGLALFTFCYLMLARELAGRGGFRVLITVLFGLIHGLGFAGAFLASDVHRDMLFLPLAGFNIGVELGQLALVALMLTLGVLMKRQVRIHTHVNELISALVCGLGVFWFVQRSFV